MASIRHEDEPPPQSNLDLAGGSHQHFNPEEITGFHISPSQIHTDRLYITTDPQPPDKPYKSDGMKEGVIIKVLTKQKLVEQGVIGWRIRGGFLATDWTLADVVSLSTKIDLNEDSDVFCLANPPIPDRPFRRIPRKYIETEYRK